jgi:hypothetical protein
VDRQATSILGLVECPQEQWQLITMEEQELPNFLPTIKRGAPLSMEMRQGLLSMALQAVSSSKM